MPAKSRKEKNQGESRAGLVIAFVVLTLLLIPILSRA
jgi:nitrate reductase NapE component